jgi:hypothetical protein
MPSECIYFPANGERRASLLYVMAQTVRFDAKERCCVLYGDCLFMVGA